MYRTKIKKVKVFQSVIKAFALLRNALCSMLFAFYTLCAMPLNLHASEIQFEAAIDRNNVSIGQGIQLNLIFHGSQDIPAPDLKDIKNFKAEYTGPSTRISIVNSKISRSVTHMYTLIPTKAGTFQIGPFSVTYKGKTYTSNPISVKVVSKPSTQKGSKQKDTFPTEEQKDRVFLVMESEKQTVFLNEIIPVSIKLYISGLTIRDIQYPVFSHNGFSVEDFNKPLQYKEVLNGKRYNVIEFNTKIFGVKKGELLLGPALLECKLFTRKRRQRPPPSDRFFDDDFFDDFFGRYRTYPLKLKAPVISMTVLPLPQEDRPDDFKGTIGDFNFDLEANPVEVKTGDPITLKMTIKGEGNFNTVSQPQLKSREGFKVYEPQVKHEGNTKIFEQILMPEKEKITAIPEMRFSFFNPVTEKYQTITRGPIPIKVEKAGAEEIKMIESRQTDLAPAKKEVLGRDIIYIKTHPGKFREKGQYIYQKLWFWAGQAAALFFLFIFLSLYKRKEKLKTDARYARHLMAPRKAKKGIKTAQRLLREHRINEFYDSIFRTIRQYFGDKFHIPIGGITVDSVEQILRERQTEEVVITKTKEIFLDCDEARYTPSETGKNQREEDTFNKIKEVINYFERQKV